MAQARAQQIHEGGPAAKRLEAAAAATAADRPVLVDGQVADLAGRAAGAVDTAPPATTRPAPMPVATFR